MGKFGKKLNFLPYLAWNSKNQQKFAKMRKRNIELDVLNQKSHSKVIFRKSGKKRAFVILAKTVIFGQNLTLPKCTL